MRRRAFTTIELLTVLIIMGIVGSMAIGLAANTEASLRADRAAREALAMLRFARMRSMTTGNTYGVAFDPTAQTVSLYLYNGTTYTTQTGSLFGGAPALLNLSTQPGLAGVTISSPATLFRCTYRALGATTNTGTVTFSYGGYSKAVVINAVGEPVLQ